MFTVRLPDSPFTPTPAMVFPEGLLQHEGLGINFRKDFPGARGGTGPSREAQGVLPGGGAELGLRSGPGTAEEEKPALPVGHGPPLPGPRPHLLPLLPLLPSVLPACPAWRSPQPPSWEPATRPLPPPRPWLSCRTLAPPEVILGVFPSSLSVLPAIAGTCVPSSLSVSPSAWCRAAVWWLFVRTVQCHSARPGSCPAGSGPGVLACAPQLRPRAGACWAPGSVHLPAAPRCPSPL